MISALILKKIELHYLHLYHTNFSMHNDEHLHYYQGYYWMAHA